MEERIVNFLKKPKTLRSLYFVGCMVASFCMGIISEYIILNSNNNPVIEIPKKPTPLAYRYKTPKVTNPIDMMPAEISPTIGESLVNNINQTVVTPTINTDSFVASKTGKKYYPAGCAGINRIKPENRVYFSSEKDAQEKGYERTATCK
jgi:hypothetical protein